MNIRYIKYQTCILNNHSSFFLIELMIALIPFNLFYILSFLIVGQVVSYFLLNLILFFGRLFKNLRN
jgi:hypothetical protein